uniref:Uncharacterized protein n=1 Tax=Panagrolaimus sp. JU765 TaxID=591449 RepID=A0AC34R6V6_9BILA
MRGEFHDDLCPNISSKDLKMSKNIKNNRIAIVIPVSKQADYESSKSALDTVECYANHFGYRYVLLDMTDDENIENNENCYHSNLLFKRHCFVVNFMKENIDQIDYVLFLDGTIGVIHPCHTIQEFIDDDPDVEITFYERYYDHKIAVESYLVRNSEFTRNFLTTLADYILPKSFHGSDSGAIHQALMDYHFKDMEAQRQCYHYWEKSENYDTLAAFQFCTRHALGNETYFAGGKIKIIGKNMWRWVRNGWLTKTKFAPNDFMFHGWKNDKLSKKWFWPFNNPNFDMNKCGYRSSFTSWIPKEGLFVPNDEIQTLLGFST